LKKVLSKQTTIKQAANKFGIKLSTAKCILRVFRNEGRIGKKTTRIRNNSKRTKKSNNKKKNYKIESIEEIE